MRRTLITARILVAGIVLTACADTSNGSSESPSNAEASGSTASDLITPDASSEASASPSESAGYEVLIVGGKITTAEICNTYTDILTKFTNRSKAQIKSGSKYVDDPYTAAKYVRNVAWVDADSEENLSELVDKAATSALNVVTDGQAGQVSDLAPYVEDSMDACGLTFQFSTAKGKATTVNELAADLYTEADNKPWYPKGFEEWNLDSNMAYKYAINKGGDPCGYSACRYGKYEVISQDGCPSGIYAEMNFMDAGGTVVDWSNDTVSYLEPMQKALLTFVSYSAPGGTIRLTEINCR